MRNTGQTIGECPEGGSHNRVARTTKVNGKTIVYYVCSKCGLMM